MGEKKEVFKNEIRTQLIYKLVKMNHVYLETFSKQLIEMKAKLEDRPSNEVEKEFNAMYLEVNDMIEQRMTGSWEKARQQFKIIDDDFYDG